MTTHSTRSSTLSPIVVRFGALGDLVLLTPLLHLLHRRYGRPCILVTSGGWARPLFADHPDVDRVLHITSRRRPYLLDPQQWRMVRALREEREGPVYVCDEKVLDKMRSLLARGHVAADRCLYVGEHPTISEVHWIDRWLRFGRLTPPAFAAADFPWRDADLVTAPLLHVTNADRDDCDAWLRSRDFAGKPLVLLQAGNKRTHKRGRFGIVGDDKHWRPEYWAELSRLIVMRMPQARIVLCGTPTEAGVLRDIQRAANLAQIHIAADDLPLRRLLALLERAHSMVSIDTGPAHAAAAMGCPLVVMYGAASPLNWKPRSSSGSAVTTLVSRTETRKVADIKPGTVAEAWQALPSRRP